MRICKLLTVQWDEHTEKPLSADELQKSLLIAEVNLGRKEKENAILREQVQQYEAKWLEYESKMKSMEDLWHNQMTSLQVSYSLISAFLLKRMSCQLDNLLIYMLNMLLSQFTSRYWCCSASKSEYGLKKCVVLLQMSLAAARMSISTDKTLSQPEKLPDSESPRFFDCEDSSSGALVPAGFTHDREPKVETTAAASGDSSRGLELAELEQNKHKYDDEARAIVKLKSLNIPWVTGGDELLSIKHKFAAWKTDIKGRLKDAKSKVPKPGYDAEKIRRKW